jgi:hypothetical protein
MQIAAQQIAALDDGRQQRFAADVVAHLRRRHAGCLVHAPRAAFVVRDLPDDTMLKLVGLALQRGRGHGLTWQSSLNAFVTLMFVVAPNFDAHPRVAAALAHDLRPPDFRMRDLPWRITAGDWREAAAAYDPHAWLGASASP